jgi:uncharacterized membrane protein YfcA
VDIYLPIAEIPVNVLLILGMSAAIGFISGMFGVGGGFLMTPLLIFIGIPPVVAVATEASQIAATTVTGSLAYWRRRALDLRLGFVLLGGGAVGTGLGVLLVSLLRAAGQLDAVVSIAYVLLLGAVGSLLLIESVRTLVKVRRGAAPVRRRHGHRSWVQRLPLKMRFRRSMIYVSVIPLLGFAALVGMTGAVLGIGGGFMLVPLLVYVFRVPTNVVVGTSLFQVLVNMLLATVLHAVTNHAVDVVLALVLMIGGAIGAQFGASAGQRLRGEQLRLFLALLLLVVAGRFAFDLVTPPANPYSYEIAGSILAEGGQ